MNQEPFVLEVHEPYSTFQGGKPVAIPYVIAGLAPQGALSALGGKAKHGKSSMSRFEAVCISKGQPFLGRTVTQGEVLLCSLEDPRQHIDNCLQILEYDKRKDARIHVVTRLPQNVIETIDILNKFLTGHPDVRFVVLDTLAKVVRARDVNDYNEMLVLCEKLHLLARHFSKLHVQVLTHCKKIATDDPFDGFLGSMEIRAETDTNIVIFDKAGRRVIQSETRMGTSWEATILTAEMGDFDGTAMVKKFSLGSAVTEGRVGDVLEKTTESDWPLGLIVMVTISGVESDPQ